MIEIVVVERLFKELNQELRKRKVVGEVCACAGRVMFLAYHTEKDTSELGEIFKPTELIHDAIKTVAKKNDLVGDWVYNAVGIFFHTDPPREDAFELSHLRIFAPLTSYILAMKCVSSSSDPLVREDVKFLISYLKCKCSEDALEVISKYYPDQTVPSKAKSLIEELVEGGREYI